MKGKSGRTLNFIRENEINFGKSQNLREIYGKSQNLRNILGNFREVTNEVNSKKI